MFFATPTTLQNTSDPAATPISHCFVGAQWFTVDGRDMTDPSHENNNKCYECILKQHGPNGLPPGVLVNDCLARGFDKGRTGIEGAHPNTIAQTQFRSSQQCPPELTRTCLAQTTA
jgi:hypothetical protein